MEHNITLCRVKAELLKTIIPVGTIIHDKLHNSGLPPEYFWLKMYTLLLFIVITKEKLKRKRIVDASRSLVVKAVYL